MSENVNLEECFISAEQPWPGLAAFTEATHRFFHGRSQATTELVSLVGTSTASVLFGQSGLGKTSLIQAGLFPQLRRMGFLPVYIRLDHAETAPSLASQIIDALLAECHRLNVDAPERVVFQGENGPESSLWAYFHRHDADFWAGGVDLVTPVLVLDQFEELFTLGRDTRAGTGGPRTAAFLEDLSCLVENRIPQFIRDKLSTIPGSGREYDFAHANCRLLLSLREDFLPDLEGLMAQLPTLRLNRMRLKPMDGHEALEVVDGGGALVEPQIGERIVRFVAADAGQSDLAQLAVEPSLLSLICSELNLRRQAQGLSAIGGDLLSGAREAILNDFYARCLTDQSPVVAELIEERLISESGYRNDLVLEDVLRLPGITRQAIDTLIQRRLLRLEERGGRLRLELIHDVMTSVARARRDARRESEAQAETQRLYARQRKRQWAMAATVIVLLFVAIGMSWLAWDAKQSKILAEQATGESEEKGRNLAKAKEETDMALLQVKESNAKVSKALEEKSAQNRDLQEALVRAKNAEEKALAQKRAAELARDRATVAEARVQEAQKQMDDPGFLEKHLSALKKRQQEELLQAENRKADVSSVQVSVERKVDAPEDQTHAIPLRELLLKGNRKYRVDDHFVRAYPELIRLILNTESMDDDERQYWFDIFKDMNESQLDRLFNILETERLKLLALEKKYEKEVAALNEKHLVEWAEFQKRKVQEAEKQWRPQYERALTAFRKGTKEGYLDAIRIAEASLDAFSELGEDVSSLAVAETHDLMARAYNATDDAQYAEIALRSRDLAISAYAKVLGQENALKKMVSALGNQSFYRLLSSQYNEALRAANTALTLAPSKVWIRANQAHAMLFLGQTEEALAVYKKNWNLKVFDDSPELFSSAVLDDFKKFRKAGLPAEKMEMIEKMMR